MESKLIGYFPKYVHLRPDDLRAEQVKEVCSVSECISPGPEDWIKRWAHNELFLFDDEQAAWRMVPGGRSNRDYRLFALRLFPLQFEGAKQRPFTIPTLSTQPLPDGYCRLGFDVVSRSCGAAFECSPLSCNYAAEQVEVNEHCLVDNLAEALRLARLFSSVEEGYEPGPYYIVEVLERAAEPLERGPHL
jgi:hypothetical protein